MLYYLNLICMVLAIVFLAWRTLILWRVRNDSTKFARGTFFVGMAWAALLNLMVYYFK